MAITKGASASHSGECVSSKINPLDYNLTQAAYSVGQLMAILPFGKTTLYAEIKRGHLKAKKLGKRTIFTAASVAEFLSSLESSKNEVANG